MTKIAEQHITKNNTIPHSDSDDTQVNLIHVWPEVILHQLLPPPLLLLPAPLLQALSLQCVTVSSHTFSHHSVSLDAQCAATMRVCFSTYSRWVIFLSDRWLYGSVRFDTCRQHIHITVWYVGCNSHCWIQYLGQCNYRYRWVLHIHYLYNISSSCWWNNLHFNTLILTYKRVSRDELWSEHLIIHCLVLSCPCIFSSPTPK